MVMYKLRAVLRGHEADVRAVAPAISPSGAVLTASRDMTCKLWAPDTSELGFSEVHVFSGHTRYVSSVCTIPPSQNYPQGLVVTGGNDNLILVFSLESSAPVMTLVGHTGTVCSLSAGKFGTLMSGSWDKTARVWINDKSVMELKGHDAAVWAVLMMPEQGLMLTGSADKTVKLWRANQCEKTYKGHSDCVRGLAIFSMNEFLSCSNDGTIRRWNLSGDCMKVYQGHSSFVYSISTIPSEDNHCNYFVSSGEDRSIRVWDNERCCQSVILPCQSVWAVAGMANGDIIVGSSDGIARIFTASSERVASETLIKEFEEEVANQAIPAAANLDLGEIKVDQLPGPEVLLRPGDRNEQTKLIKRSGVIEAHQWDETNQRWQKIGEVVGKAGSEGSARKSGKSLYNGKEYDYVFDVDIQEGHPPLKLPFNITDDPWVAAHHFLQKNDLSPLFLDQVANFIIKNTEGVTLGGPPSALSDPFTGGNRYVPGSGNNPSDPGGSEPRGDPFTGGNRYVPGTGSNSRSSNDPKAPRGDPFTGGSRYVPVSDVKKAVEDNRLPDSSYFPKKSFLFFETGKVEPIVNKIKEFNKVVEENKVLKETEIDLLTETLGKCCSGKIKDESLPMATGTTLEKLLAWPLDKVFPGLDSLRLHITSKDILEYFTQADRGDQFVQYLFVVASKNSPPANGTLVCRMICNCFYHQQGKNFVMKHKAQLLDLCTMVSEMENRNVRTAAASVLLNFSVAQGANSTFEENTPLIFNVCKLLQQVTDPESQFRLLVALGTLICNDQDALALCKSLDIEVKIDALAAIKDSQKVADAAVQVSALIKSFH